MVKNLKAIHLKKSQIFYLMGLFLISLGTYLLDQQLTLPRGLEGKYYANLSWQGDPQFDALDPEISTALLKERRRRFSENRFSIEWNGFVVIDRSGEYTFATASDDGSWLYVNQQLIVDNGGTHGLQKVSGQIYLDAGVYPFQIRYFQAGGYHVLDLFWARGNRPLKTLPSYLLLPHPISYWDYKLRRGLDHFIVFLKWIWLGTLVYFIRLYLFRWPSSYLLLASMLVMYCRAPSLFSKPRFWAEEGTAYFSYAFSHSWYNMLLTPHEEYFSLFANIASALAANLVQLKHAPLVTTLLAFVVQVIPLIIILWSKSSLWDTTTKKAIGMLIILFTPSSGEIWLNTINSQFYFSLITFLILMENVAGVTPPYKIWSYRILLLLSGLTGLVSCFLTPLFIGKAWLEKRREYMVQAGILSLCSLLQLWVLWTSMKSDFNAAVKVAVRFTGIDLPTVFSLLWTKTILLSFVGPDIADYFAGVFTRIRDLGHDEFKFLGLILFLLTAIFFWYISRKVEPRKRVIILGSFFLITLLSIVSSLTPGDKFHLIYAGAAERYFYVPNVILIILILSNIQFRGNPFKTIRSGLCVTLLATSLTLGVMHYRKAFIMDAHRPTWSAEVLRWQENPEYALQIWPAGWKITLKDRDQ